MADTVSVKTLKATGRQRIVMLHGASDGTGESNVVKVDKSALTTFAGVEPSALAVDFIQYAVQGYTKITLSWDLTTDELIAAIPQGGSILLLADYTHGDVLPTNGGVPVGAGGTGDILLSTTGAINGGSYTIILGLTLVV